MHMDFRFDLIYIEDVTTVLRLFHILSILLYVCNLKR